MKQFHQRANVQQTSFHRTSMTNDASYVLSKQEYTVETYVGDRKFSGAPEQSIDATVRDFEISATQ